MPQNKPLYIAFEGGEGSGKSTQAKLLVEALGEIAVLTKEPGGTAIGAQLRAILLGTDTHGLDPMAEAFLMAADRTQHADEVVRPSIDDGLSVVSDRSFGSAIAYQGSGRELGELEILNLNLMNPNFILPDIMFILLNPSADEIAKRLNRDLDRFEQAGDDFHARVALSFGQMAHFLKADGRTEDIHTVTISPTDGARLKSPEEIHVEVMEGLQVFCDEKGYASLIPSSSS